MIDEHKTHQKLEMIAGVPIVKVDNASHVAS